DLAVVPTHLDVAATAAGCFFERRWSGIPALSDHQKCRAPSVPAEGQGSYTHPTAVAFDEIAPPCLWLDKFQARQKYRIPTPCAAFLDFQPPKSPTRIHEDPEFF